MREQRDRERAEQRERGRDRESRGTERESRAEIERAEGERWRSRAEQREIESGAERNRKSRDQGYILGKESATAFCDLMRSLILSSFPPAVAPIFFGGINKSATDLSTISYRSRSLVIIATNFLFGRYYQQ